MKVLWVMGWDSLPVSANDRLNPACMAFKLEAPVPWCPRDISYKLIVTPEGFSDLYVHIQSQHSHTHLTAVASLETHTEPMTCVRRSSHTHAARMHSTGKCSSFDLGPEHTKVEPTTTRNWKWGPQTPIPLPLPSSPCCAWLPRTVFICPITTLLHRPCLCLAHPWQPAYLCPRLSYMLC